MTPLAIVVVHKGDYAKLDRTLASIKSKIPPTKKLEVVLIDASIEAQKRDYVFLSGYSFLEIQEHDLGIFDGMNKGIKYSKSKYILFLNSGDYLFDATDFRNLERVLEFENHNWLLIESCIEIENGVFKDWKLPTENKFFWGLNSYCHQAQIIDRNFLIEINGYNKQSRIADYEVSFLLNKVSKPYLVSGVKVATEKRGFSQSYSFFDWTRDIINFRRLNEIRYFRFFFLDTISQIAIAILLSFRKLFTRKNFND